MKLVAEQLGGAQDPRFQPKNPISQLVHDAKNSNGFEYDLGREVEEKKS